MKNPTKIYDDIAALSDRTPAHARVENTDLVIVKYDEAISVLYGRCLHRGALRLLIKETVAVLCLIWMEKLSV